MCTREEVRAEVEAGERRMEARMFESHAAIAKTVSNHVDEMTRSIEKLNTKTDKLADKTDIAVLDRNSIHAALDSLKEGQVKILDQTTKHNGRMTKLERWQSYVIGAVAVLTTLVLPIVFMIVNEIIGHVKIGI